MEECVRLVCETLGVHTLEEVSEEKIADLYQKVFHTAAKLRDVQRAVTQVSAQNGGLPCSGHWILHVLLEMEKEREKREKLFWELQMLRSGHSGASDRVDTHTLSRKSTGLSNGDTHKKQSTKPCSLLSLFGQARRLYVRLDVDGVWSLLPSLIHGHQTSRRLGLISPTKSDVLLLLEYKYDLIKERLYREMLQEEHGPGCWESMEPSEQTDCVCDLEQRAEEALNLSDVLRVCELPGILHCYSRRADQVEVREQTWTSSPQGQSWTSAIFLSELHSHCEEERRSLTQLLNRVERLVLTEIYLSVCVSVRRAEEETHSHTALLTSRQHWDNWPCVRRLDVEDLVKFWLQEKTDQVKPLRNECRTSRCVRQQAVLQCVVQCQDQERRMLVEILQTVSQDELQELTHTLTPDSRTSGCTLRRGCVSVLNQIKSSLQSSFTHSTVSWDECAVHLLTQLTHTHDQEIQTVIHTLTVMDAAALLVLLQKYQLELRSPKLHNLHLLLQTASSETTPRNISVTDGSRSSPAEERETCTGCGVVLIPENTPYLEILGIGQKREEERREGREGEEEERREEKEGEEERREGKEGEEERREGREREKERREEREGKEKERREGKKGGEEIREGKEGEVERREGREGEKERREERERKEKERREGKEGEEERREEKDGEEERREGREGEKERREERERKEKDRREGKEGEEERREEKDGEEERREGREGEKERREEREGKEKEWREGKEGEEEWQVDALEKQASLITLAWSRPANNNTQEVTSALLTETTSTETHTPDPTHSGSLLCEHTVTAHTHTHTLVEPLQEPPSSSTDIQNDTSSDEHRTSSSSSSSPSAAVVVNSGKTPGSGRTHTQNTVCEEQQLQREATMHSLVHIQRRAEQRWQRDRDRQILRVQERLSIIQNRKSEEGLLGLRREETFRHLTNTVQQEDEQQQKMMVREKLQQMWRERSYVLQSRRERNTTEFKELLTPTTQCVSNAEDVLDSHTHLNTYTHPDTTHTHTHLNTYTHPDTTHTHTHTHL